jgi:hypothetical protein
MLAADGKRDVPDRGPDRGGVTCIV